MSYYSTFTYGGLTLYAENISVRRVSPTYKSVVSKKIIKTTIAGRNQWENEITINGEIYASTKDSDRASLEALQDGEEHAFADGVSDHAGDYYIDNDGLVFEDSGSNTVSYKYTLVLTQHKQ